MRSLLFAYLTLSTFAACSKSTPMLDDKLVTDNIRQMVEPAGMKLKSVDCPTKRAVKAGDKFTCTAVTESGEKFTVNMEQKEGGSLLSTVEGALIHPPTVVKSGAARFGFSPTATATCSKWISKVNEVVTCEVNDGGKMRKLEVKTLGLDGSFDAHEVGQPDAAKPPEGGEGQDKHEAGSDAHETHE